MGEDGWVGFEQGGQVAETERRKVWSKWTCEKDESNDKESGER